MTEGVGAGATSPEDAAAARAAEQARIRKERREAKIKAGGSARLNKITGLGGGLQRDPIPQPPTAEQPSNTAAASPAAAEHADPAEVDISEHYYAPRATPRRPADSSPVPAPPTPPSAADMSEAQLRQLMLGLDPRAGAPPFPGPPGANDEDPMMKLLSQMMGGGMPGAGGGPGMFPPGMMGGGTAPQQAAAAAVPPPVDTYAVAWRLLHLAVALGLGLYMALFSSFNGTREARDRAARASADGIPDLLDGDDAERRHLFFWGFATAEAVLITSRFFLDRARAPPSGIIWTVASFLPGPFRGYAESVLRYGQIFSTIRSDLLVCVFILGVSSWLQSCSLCSLGQ
ncbi:hypothetical protein RB595_005367 [Gaeumannomyces hyphopodioides]